MKKMKNTLGFFILFLLGMQTLFATVVVPLDNPYISYDGVYYPQITPSKVVLNRHLPAMLNDWESGIAGAWINQWVITQTGVRIRFKTASPTIDLAFTQRATGGTIGGTPTSGFSVFVAGVSIATYSSLAFTVNNPNAGTATTFEVSLPNLWSVDFTGMNLADGYTLEDPGALNKPVYVAIGNSITHGTGQYVSSAKGYAFILANKMGWDLHNIAVAGATLGWSIAKNIKGKHVDHITIKIGFNDFKYSTATLASKKTEYGKLIDTLRANHPNAKIYCITPIFSNDNTGAAPYVLADFRTMVTEVVTDRQVSDKNLCLIYGPDISDASMLASGDPTHLSEYGANLFANNLYAKINNCALSVNAIEMEQANAGITITTINAGRLQMQVNYSGKYAVSLYSTEGREVYHNETTFDNIGANTLLWDQSQLSGGMYIVKVRGEHLDSTAMKVVFE